MGTPRHVSVMDINSTIGAANNKQVCGARHIRHFGISTFGLFGLYPSSLSKSSGFVSLAGKASLVSISDAKDAIMFIYRWNSNFVEKVVLEREHGGRDAISYLLPCVLYCMEGEFEQIVMKLNFVWALRTTTTNCRVSFIYFYSVFPTNFRIVFLPHTNTVILLEPYCGTMTEPGLPVIWQSF